MKQAMGLGLCGAHRVGKTTVAAAIAETNGCPFIQSSATTVAADMGLKVDVGMAPADRRRFQTEVLRRFVILYEEQAGKGFFVTDRTPMDFAAYALADWTPGDEEHDDWIMGYVEDCMDAASKYFYVLALIQPGIPYVSGEGKPALNVVYQEILNTTMMGLCRDPKVDCHFTVLGREVTDTAQRVNGVSNFYVEKATALSVAMKARYTRQ